MQFQPGRITSSRFDALTKLRPTAYSDAVRIFTVILFQLFTFKKAANVHFCSQNIAHCVEIISNKIAKPYNKTHAVLKIVLYRFEISFA